MIALAGDKVEILDHFHALIFNRDGTSREWCEMQKTPRTPVSVTPTRETIETIEVANRLLIFTFMVFELLRDSKDLLPRKIHDETVDPKQALPFFLTQISGDYWKLHQLLFASDQSRVLRWLYHPRSVEFDGEGYQSYSMAALTKVGNFLGSMPRGSAEFSRHSKIHVEEMFANWPTARLGLFSQAFDCSRLGDRVVDELTAVQDLILVDAYDATAEELADPKNYSKRHPVEKYWLKKYNFGSDTWQRRRKSGEIRISTQSTTKSVAIFYKDWPPGYTE